MKSWLRRPTTSPHSRILGAIVELVEALKLWECGGREGQKLEDRRKNCPDFFFLNGENFITRKGKPEYTEKTKKRKAATHDRRGGNRKQKKRKLSISEGENRIESIKRMISEGKGFIN